MRREQDGNKKGAGLVSVPQQCRLDHGCQSPLKGAMAEMGLSARAHDKVLRAARTIADLDRSPDIRPSHLSEAINYRMLDRQLWT